MYICIYTYIYIYMYVYMCVYTDRYTDIHHNQHCTIASSGLGLVLAQKDPWRGLIHPLCGRLAPTNPWETGSAQSLGDLTHTILGRHAPHSPWETCSTQSLSAFADDYSGTPLLRNNHGRVATCSCRQHGRPSALTWVEAVWANRGTHMLSEC